MRPFPCVLYPFAGTTRTRLLLLDCLGYACSGAMDYAAGLEAPCPGSSSSILNGGCICPDWQSHQPYADQIRSDQHGTGQVPVGYRPQRRDGCSAAINGRVASYCMRGGYAVLAADMQEVEPTRVRYRGGANVQRDVGLHACMRLLGSLLKVTDYRNLDCGIAAKLAGLSIELLYRTERGFKPT